VGGARVSDYPRAKLLINRVVKLGIRFLFGHGYTTRRTPSRPTGARVIETVQPLLSAPLNLTVELPSRRSSRPLLRDRPIRWQPNDRDQQAAPAGDGQPVSLHRAQVFLEHI